MAKERFEKEINQKNEIEKEDIVINDEENFEKNEKTTEKINNQEKIETNNMPEEKTSRRKGDLLDKIVKKEMSEFKPVKVEKTGLKKKKIVIFSLIFVVFLIITSVCIFVILNKTNSNVYKNVYCLENDFSNKTTDEVSNILKEKSIKIKEGRELDIYQESEKIYSVKSEEIDLNIDVAATTKEIMGFGRTDNIFKNSFIIFKNVFSKKEIKPIYIYDQNKLEDVVKNAELTLKNRFVDDSYNLDTKTNKLIIKKGTSGATINNEIEKNKIFEALSQNIDKIQFEIINKKPSNLDVNKVHDEVKKEPKDAYIDKATTPSKFVKEQVGYEFNTVDLEKLLNLDENKVEGKVIEFSLTVLQPKTKLADINYTLYKEKIVGYTTYFDVNNAARVNNLSVALSYLNEKIIMPGEIFSYNEAIGDTTAAKGYKEAATFKGGTVVMEMGGGICQTSSTLYNVALMANLEIVERHPHGLPVAYVPPSRDATVYSPVLDFRFKNTRNYPVKIVTSFSSSGNLNISLFGTKEETEYEMVITSNTVSTVPFKTEYVNDDSLAKGQQVVKKEGVNGYTSEGFISKKLNGAVISKTLLSKDTYNAQSKIVSVGTK